MSNLQEKWQELFHFLNINNDDVLDLADVTLDQDNFVRLHNQTVEEVHVCANDARNIWGAHSHLSQCTWYLYHGVLHAPAVQCFVHMFTCSTVVSFISDDAFYPVSSLRLRDDETGNKVYVADYISKSKRNSVMQIAKNHKDWTKYYLYYINP